MLENQGETEISERYQIRQHLGSGGSGDAYLAWDTSLRREVVIKRVRTENAEEDAVRQILEEAAKMAAIKHPNIVSVYDITSSEGAPCIVMEHVIGSNLDEYISKNGPLSGEDFVDLARQALDALYTAHQAGLIHRDIKPSNIMLSGLPSGLFQAKVLDFGMAKFVDPQAPSPQTVMIDGSIRGTIHYISPEQLNHDPVDVRSDLYSLGCTLYYALTGLQPFHGQSVAEVITAHLVHRVSSPAEVLPTVPPGISGWLMRLIQRKPGERYQDALTAMKDLKDAAQADGILSSTTSSIRLIESPPQQPPVSTTTTPPPSSSEPRKKQTLPVLLLAGLVLTALVIAALLFRGQSSSGDGANVVSPPPAPEAISEPTPALAQPVNPVQETPTVTANPVEEPAPLPAPEIIFEVAGSNTIGAALMPGLIHGYLKHIKAEEIQSESPSEEETLVSFQAPGSTAREAILIKAHGSSTSFKALKAQTTELGMSSRPIKSAEVEDLAFLGDMLSPASEHVVGLDGLAVIVNHSNPVQALTLSQVAKIFAGEIVDWSEVGGKPGPIALYARDDKSGTYDTFKSIVLGERILRPDSSRFEDSNELSDRVSQDPSGIGFIGLPYVRNSKALALSDEGTTTMMPSPFTVATEDYVIARRLFLYTPGVPKHPWIMPFVEFALSPDGQEIVEAVGFISQQVEIEPMKTSEKMPPEYARIVGESQGRLSVNFRFRPGSTEIDAKAIRDMDRVVRFLAKPENRNKQIYLLGFSDSSGSPSSNLELAQQRADEVARQMALRGVPVAAVLGMGDAMPVASNTTKAGQEKNRRVEVWLD